MSRAARRKKKRVWPWIVGGIGLVLLAVIVYGVMIYLNLTKTAKNMHEPIDREVSEMRVQPVAFKDKEPFSMLVLGVDERDGDKGRSDTLIVLTVNPETNSTKMVSIPRDTYTEIVGKDIKDKINHAYAFGGIEMALATVENFLDIPIDYVMQVNMESFKDIVDAVGGITVNNALDFNVGSYTFPKGTIELNGDKALDFVRMRKQDPRGDFGRQDRQKQVLQGVIREGASVNSLLNYKDIFGAIGNNVRTNMTFDEMVEVQKNYRAAAGKVDQLYIEKGTGETINKIWYYMMNDAELQSIQDELKEHLELK
ncbi:polyisoprenyl-teichoic acid--peptidoglycan teichoic acid transferase TagU [Sporosarcina sp. G11-34]|uniref:polyisoprenyl-teichoic acid--peptidoglycan teichoic acid transferase TagU n=1 Tax=Sporosarcina sp. G11-34 TaxID=2849605 RepID=UPI0022A9A8D8|nr:LytR family transcriptional regulator [Sporosarcina sp. G11-34]MCZ2258644.1 LytR family transcriptional regulator [Sporosarcina sp. G11-34]